MPPVLRALILALVLGGTRVAELRAEPGGAETTRVAELRAEHDGAETTRLDAAPPELPADILIGYTEFRTNLPGGRHVNIKSMRACLVQADGAGRRMIADGLAKPPDTWTQFAGWSPDGRTAIVGRGWESAENGRWEEENKTFRYRAEDYRVDSYLVDLETGQPTNVTEVERVSFYNTGLFFWPGDATKLGFQALIGSGSNPFRMDRDGRNKRDLTKDSKEFAYGFSASPDGKRIAYHKNYQVYLADADGANARRVETGHPFNFSPKWSPDGSAVLFVSGEHYHCHPYVVKADGSDLKKLADRGGYRGVVEFLDVPDFHGGSSDVPVWSSDGRSVFYTAQLAGGVQLPGGAQLPGGTVELFRVTLDGKSERLTESPEGALHYHPLPSPEGRWLLYGSKRSGVRQLYLMRLQDKKERRLTNLSAGTAAMWPHWQPTGKGR